MAKKQPKKKPKKSMARKGFDNLVSTQCTNCNLRLVIPEVESHRCVLCGCKELNKQAWNNA